MMLKALQLLHFWSVLLKEQMMTSVRKTLKPWSDHPENNHKIRRFFYQLLSGQVCLKDSREIPAKSADFSAILSLKILRNLTFFPQTIRSPVSDHPGGHLGNIHRHCTGFDEFCWQFLAWD